MVRPQEVGSPTKAAIAAKERERLKQQEQHKKAVLEKLREQEQLDQLATTVTTDAQRAQNRLNFLLKQVRAMARLLSSMTRGTGV